ncbi:MAG: apolipoprotein N-acyltransferase, partial [Bacteroidetes bacterium]
MINIKNYKFGLLSGILFGLSWNSYFPVLSLFLAFIPLLYTRKYLKVTFIDFFNISFFAFIIFHLATVWWISKSSIPGFIAVITLNSLFMASVMGLFYLIYAKLNKYLAYFSFVVFWLSFEFFHFHWEISWPFMNLGNWFGQTPNLVQWYEYTGVSGGTLWILLINILLFESADLFFQHKKRTAIIILGFSIVLLISPIYISNQIISEPKKNGKSISILLVQPNINPYTEKYETSLFKNQINEQIQLVKDNINSQTELIIYPEASFPLFLNQDSLFSDKDLNRLQNLVDTNSKIDIIAGLFTYDLIKTDTIYYNTAIHLSSNKNYTLYFKSKLVPAVEKTPFANYFKFLKNLNVNFGGITSSLGVSNQRTVFKTSNVIIAPVICYESVYGELVTEFVKNGAEIITVMTNDAWWGNTPAYNQILMHSKLRAIETRRTVIRSANTGISCLIDKNGIIKNTMPKNKKAV